jgi:two-component system response regulator RegX3
VGLKREGFDVSVARDGNEALRRFEDELPDLVLLDVMLPRLSGVDVCRAIRARSPVPIIMVSARSAEIDTVVGLEVGADDYVAKPFGLRELVSRMRAVLRRASSAAEPQPSPRTPARVPAAEVNGREPEPLEVGGVQLDLGRHECIVRGREVRLPLKQFELLAQLLLNAGRVMTREVLIDRVWGMDYVGDTRTLDVHVKRLRGLIEEDPARPRLISTIRGVGYRYEVPKRA